ncbi:MAG TPA: vWA domain-containing protein, partial [Pseudomonas sp.]|nr:vWA domain-containing protein [Pseudomonas sp.]
PAQPPAPASSSRLPLLGGAGLVALLALAWGGYWLFGPDGAPPKTAGATQVVDGAQPEEPTLGTTGLAATDSPPLANADGGDRPLLMVGKQSLFQRVLSKPGAQLADSAGGPASNQALPAFSVLYVYAREQRGEQSWLRVGASSEGHSQGWLPASQVSDWKQSLVLKFTERSGRAPVMFLRQPEDVERLLADTQAARDEQVRAQRDDGSAPQVLAIEPQANAISHEQFYLLPIFEARESFDNQGQPVQLLNVASIDPGNTPQVREPGTEAARPDAFRTGIVLVVDTSVSMQPYIDQVNQVVKGLQEQIASRGELDRVSFGMVGFRSNTDKTPGLEYVTKTLVPLQPDNDPQRFLELAWDVKATTVSSHAFNEDAFAGVMDAVDGMDWSPYAGRLILLVTDAGALRKNDPLGRTQMNEAEVREAALRKRIKIYALHLRTDAGQANHGYAEQQYRSLTADANPKIGDLYVSVAGGDVGKFGDTVSEIGSVFADLVHQAGEQQVQAAPQLQGDLNLAAKSAAIGYAMHMDFLGQRSAAQAPQLVTAWTADRDLTNPSLPAFQVCVLLSKLQLNDLQQALKVIVDAARRTQSSSKDFFQEIASASAYMSRDPSKLVKGSNLAESGILGEYLEGLPYRSKSLSMTQDLWLSLSVAEQQDFIDELESKIRLYESFHNDVGNWVRFGDAEPGDALYRVPLSTLP